MAATTAKITVTRTLARTAATLAKHRHTTRRARPAIRLQLNPPGAHNRIIRRRRTSTKPRITSILRLLHPGRISPSRPLLLVHTRLRRPDSRHTASRTARPHTLTAQRRPEDLTGTPTHKARATAHHPAGRTSIRRRRRRATMRSTLEGQAAHHSMEASHLTKVVPRLFRMVHTRIRGKAMVLRRTECVWSACELPDISSRFLS
jgi:hypothetical protein